MTKRRTHVPFDAGRVSRPRPSERETKAPSATWDRVKFVTLLFLLWLAGLATVWTTSVHPLGGPMSDAVRIAVQDYTWLIVLAALEILRQLHYLIEEHSKGYYHQNAGLSILTKADGTWKAIHDIWNTDSR